MLTQNIKWPTLGENPVLLVEKENANTIPWTPWCDMYNGVCRSGQPNFDCILLDDRSASTCTHSGYHGVLHSV